MRPTRTLPGIDAARRRERELARISAVHRQLTAPHVISHRSAALLHGCPLWRTPTAVHVIQGYGPSAGAAQDIVRHRLTPSDDEIVLIRGMRVTSRARTAVDCVTSLPALDGLVVADWMLAHGVDRDEALALLAARTDRRGTRVGRAVLTHADAGAESAWESWLRYVLLAAGFPAPRTQVPVTTRLGTFHTDLGWLEWRLVLEFDGFVKYQDNVLRPGYDADRARFEEKRREDAIRETGLRLLRFTSRDRADDVVGRVLPLVPDQVRSTLRRNPLFPQP